MLCLTDFILCRFFFKVIDIHRLFGVGFVQGLWSVKCVGVWQSSCDMI